MPVNSLIPGYGATPAWQRLRKYYETLLPLPCWRCGLPITEDDEWDLGHRVDRAHGGTDEDAWPEHRRRIPGVCIGNRNAGAIVRRQRVAAASREW